MSRPRNVLHSTLERLRKPVAFTLVAALGLAACAKMNKDEWAGKIPLCGIPIVAIEQPKEVPLITVTTNKDGSVGPKIPNPVLSKVKAAILKIKYMDGDRVVRTGSGVMVNRRIATAAHTISGLDPKQIVVERPDGSEIPLDDDPYAHCVEYIVDGKRTVPKDSHGNSTLDAALLTPAVPTEPGLTYAIAERNWGIYGGYADRDTAEIAVGLQVITGSNREFPNGQMLTDLNGAPSERGDSGGLTANMLGACTGIVVGASDSNLDATYLKEHVGVNVSPGHYQLTDTVLSQDLMAMEAVLNARGTSPSAVPS